MRPDENPVLKDYPVSKFSAFLMMRFDPRSPFPQIRDYIEAEAARYSIRVLRADEANYKNDLWENIRSCMHACDLGIAVFDQLRLTGGRSNPLNGTYFNPNVSLELGYMLARANAEGRDDKVLLLKERRLKRLPTDVVGRLYREFDARPTKLADTLRGAMRQWLHDIGFAKGRNEKLVVFVSEGGQDRCAMAKVIANDAFKNRRPRYHLRFESMAAELREGIGSSEPAKEAVRAFFKERGYQNSDLLADHRVMHKCQGIIDDADLILVMEEGFLRSFPLDKTHLITQFFGAPGEVSDPYPSQKVQDYLKCLRQLDGLISGNHGRILQSLKNVGEPKIIAVHSRLAPTEEALKGLRKIAQASCPVCNAVYALYAPSRTASRLSRTSRQRDAHKLCVWLDKEHKKRESDGSTHHPAKLAIPDDLIG